MPRDLPEGSVTLLFTDIEGSTRLLRELGEEAYAEALLEHRQVLRSAFARHGGVEVDTQGDALFIVFPGASSGVEAAREAQEALAGGAIRVRMGLHTGAPRLTEEGYVGPAVHKGARIAAAGHGGQVLMSIETRRLIGAEVTDLGEHRLKDFDEPIWIFQLGRERFPPLTSISNTNVPRPASSFVGRQRELDEVIALLREGARLLTLTGPGGSGKTRLAVEAATELLSDFRNGVFWVDLAPLRDASLVAEVIRQALGAKVDLAEHIRERELLVLLDNFEQVVEAAPLLVPLLEACSNLKLLITSREALRVPGEVQYPVPPLTEAEAAWLFHARAGTGPDETVRRLCQALDHLPLAIELAAARTSVLSPAQILERIMERLDLLKAGRAADPRQASLRATIDWSYGLLTDEEKALFARLAVFRGSASLGSLQEVTDADLDTLQSLVEKNLLRHEAERFWMLETIREYADGRLQLSGESDAWRRRHALHFLKMAEDAQPQLRAEAAGWPERLEPDHDNIRAAVEHFAGSGETQLALRLAGAFWRFWFAKGHLTEGRRRMEDLLRVDEAPTAARASALIGASMLATNGGDPVTGRAWAEEAISLHPQLVDPQGAADAQQILGFSYAAEGDLERARRAFDASARAFRDLGDEHYELVATRMLVWALHELGDRDRALALGEENLRRARALGDAPAEAMTLGGLALIAAGDGRFDEALSMLSQSLRLFRDLGDPVGITFDLCRLAHVLALAGRAETAALLLASSETLSGDIGENVPWYEQMRQKTLSRIRADLNEAALADAMQKGRALHAEEAVTFILDHLDRSAEGPGGELPTPHP